MLHVDPAPFLRAGAQSNLIEINIAPVGQFAPSFQFHQIENIFPRVCRAKDAMSVDDDQSIGVRTTLAFPNTWTEASAQVPLSNDVIAGCEATGDETSSTVQISARDSGNRTCRLLR